MLPDYPTLKAKLFTHWTNYMEAKYREFMGFAGQSPHRRNYEGRLWRIERADDSLSESGYQELESKMELDLREVPELTPEKIAQKMEQIAKDMAHQTERGLFEQLNHDLAEAGRVTDAGNRPFDKQMLLDLLESVEIDFDKLGQPIVPSLVMSPQMWDHIKDDVVNWEQDANFRDRHQQIMVRKREDWRVRESHRKLVE